MSTTNIMTLQLFLLVQTFTLSIVLGFTVQPLTISQRSSGLYSSNKGVHTYIEGEDFSGREIDEIEALGGDPAFFLEEGEFCSVVPDASAPFEQQPQRHATDGMGPTPRKTNKYAEMDEWDGTVDDEAHLGLD
jgi:hypothetical protein